MRQVLFIQGGGASAHDEWDDKLVASLERALGDEFAVRYPQMPDEDDPSYAAWGPAIRRELAQLNGGAVVVGHSVGGTLLVRAVCDQPPRQELGGLLLIGAPFVGAGGWPGQEFEFVNGLGAELPRGVPVHVFHGLDDQTVPSSHAELYTRVVGQARLHLLPGADHQLNNDLSRVATAIQLDDAVGREPAADATSTR